MRKKVLTGLQDGLKADPSSVQTVGYRTDAWNCCSYFGTTREADTKEGREET